MGSGPPFKRNVVRERVHRDEHGFRESKFK
jgi:hypothetical protein